MAGLPARAQSSTLVDIVERVLDKGLVLNADIVISIVGTELIGIRIRAALASFETAARYGLEFPGGTRLTPQLAADVQERREECPGCGRREARELLLRRGCPWCGWRRPDAGGRVLPTT